MTLDEVEELLLLNRWTRTHLAEKLGRCRNTIDRWWSKKPSQRLRPGVPECLVMRTWLVQAREDAMRRWAKEKESIPIGQLA